MTTVGSFTEASCDTNYTSGLSDGSTTSVRHITHTANARIVVGSGVSGTGIPTGTFIVKKNTATCFTISADTTATNTDTTLTFSNIVNVFAMGKGTTEGTESEAKINKTADSVANYTGNFLESAIYKTPLNPLLSRGMVSLDFADFTMVSNATTINSYEIHKADNTTLTNAKTGINQSNSSTQTYSAVNRKYPDSTTIDTHLSNLAVTSGNTLKIYDFLTQTGQKLVHERTLINETLTAIDNIVTVDSASNLIVDDIIIVNNEEMLITGISSLNLSVIRGYNNTEAVAHADDSYVFEKERIDSLWVLIYSDDPNKHHFAKITELLEDDVYGDRIEFTPSLGVDILKDTKFAIFTSYDSNMPKIDSDNQTLVACAYGLQSDSSNLRHYLNTHVSRPFFYFLNGKDKLEPATRYVLRSSSWNGSSHTYTYSTFLTEQEYSTDIIDSGPYTMEATLVDMLYKADNPAAMNFLEYTSNNLALTNGTPDTVTIATDGSFALVDSSLGTYTNLDGTEGTDWGLTGILRDSRFTLDGAEADTYCLDSATDSTVTTLTMDAADFSGASTSNDLRIRFLAHAVDLDHNKMYCSIDSTNHLKHSFRMAHRPNDDGSSYYGHNIGQTRYLHYTDSPLTNTIIPNALEMIDYESVTATGGYVDIVLADTQKILAKKMKEGDPIYIHQIFATEEIGKSRNEPIGTVEYSTTNSNINDINAVDLGSKNDLRFLLSSPIPNSKTLTSSRYDPLYDTFTVNASGTLYHFTPNYIVNKSGSLSDEQVMRIIRWRKQDDTEYKLATTTDLSTVPNFSTTAYRSKYSFLVDNIISQIPTDTDMSNYILDYNGATAPTNWNRNVRDFQTVIENKNPSDNTRPTINIGEISLEKASSSRINDINLVLRGGQMTGHRIKVEYGDKDNKFLKLKPHLKDERFLESYNRTDYLPYADKLSNVSLYGYPINSDFDAGGSLYRYNIEQSPASITNTHVRGVVSYLDYFAGQFDIEKRIFSGIIESIEQVIEDGMFKLKIKGRNNIAKLLGPIVNKDFKFTEDIVYSTVGPIERMSMLGTINRPDNGVYEVGTTVIEVLEQGSQASLTPLIGDLLFTSQGVFIGRIFSFTVSTNDYDITLEEGIPTRLKEGETIMFSPKWTNTSDVIPLELDDISNTSSRVEQYIKGNTVSFAKAMSSNPYITTRVNSLLGAGNKGVIFTDGRNLTLSNSKAPYKDGDTLVGTSSGTHPLAKGYSINSIDKVDYDFPFYCHLADEITNKYTIDYVNLHTVNSLTEYDIININSKDKETILEVAPICPAVFARVDNNPLDSRDKYLLTVGDFPDTQVKGYSGIFQFSTWIEELNEGDFIFDSDGNLFGKIIDISAGSSDGISNNRIAFTLDRPLFKSVTSSEAIYKYYGEASPPQYLAGTLIKFEQNTDVHSFGSAAFQIGRIKSTNPTTYTFLRTLKQGMRIKLEQQDASKGHTSLNGVFTVGYVFEDEVLQLGEVIFFTRKLDGTNITGSSGQGVFENDTTGQDVKITVLTDYFTQGLYFLNTQGLSQGGVLTLTNPILSSPNAAETVGRQTCKPIKWAGGIYHHITDSSVAANASGAYTPTYSSIYSDVIDRYGNTKWRYFGLQKGQYLSYINRRRKDGQIKEAYNTEKGRVNGYATAYRIADAKYGKNRLMKYPYGYHNNDFAWSVTHAGLTTASAYTTDISLFSFNSGSGDPATNMYKIHPYFLEHLSPESRDFRPVTGSNFADFNKHGTTITSPENSSHEVLSYPRYMPRIHDNYRGGDWQEDVESPLNSDLPETVLQYRRWKTNSDNDYDYDVEWDGGSTDSAYIHPAPALDGSVFAKSLLAQWVKLGGWPDKNNNRTFKLGGLANTKYIMDYGKVPFTQLGTVVAAQGFGVGGVDDNTTGYEEISILYPPFIGPKFDGITRAKDHWELPDPKTMRWFIFSPADMYPDSMSRKHHIGYSGVVDGNTVNRNFTDYSILLKGDSVFGNSNTNHEYYEGSLQEEYETDENYQTLPISSSSIVPSEMKRFGLMRLIDCTYDWHFNLIDPERLPNDISKLNTPNFEYTRYQPLRRVALIITSYATSDTVVTTIGNPSGILANGDQIFTDEGHYLGKVKANNTSSTSFTLVDECRKPLIKSDGTPQLYYNYIYVCGDGQTTLANQTVSDSFYRFHTKGRGSKNTFTEVSPSLGLNMLQQMWNAAMHQTGKLPILTHSSPAYPPTNYLATTDNNTYWQIPYGVIEGAGNAQSSGAHSTSGKGIGIEDGDYAQTTLIIGVDKDVDENITESRFLDHFNQNFTQLFGPYNIDNGDTTNTGYNIYTPYTSHIMTLPPSFRTFYSTAYSKASTGQTINVMQEKQHLVNKIETPVNSGVDVAEPNFIANNQVTIVVDGVDATTKFPVNSVVYNPSNVPVGVVRKVSANLITLYEMNAVAVNDNEDLHYAKGNEIETEYVHSSNILEWIQAGGNPYVGCNVISLGSYSVEDSLPINIPVGVRTKVQSRQRHITRNFPYSKTSYSAVPSGDSEDEAKATYGDGYGTSDSLYNHADSAEYSFLATLGDWRYGFYNFSGEKKFDSDACGYVGTGDGYIASGIYGVFHPNLFLGNYSGRTLNFTGADETQEGVFTFDSINQEARKALSSFKPDMAVLRLTSSPTDDNDKNSWLNFVDLTGMYLIGNFGTTEGEKPTRLDYAPFSGEIGSFDIAYDLTMDEVYDFPEFTDGTNIATSTKLKVDREEFHIAGCVYSDSSTTVTHPADKRIVAGLRVSGFALGNINSGITLHKIASITDSTHFVLSSAPTSDASSSQTNTLGFLSSQGDYTPMNDCMVDPKHIIYVHEHKRNITGKTVAHELLIDNVPYNKKGEVHFFNNYRIMRPAETCLWKNSPNEISIGKLSGATTKMPQKETMYDYVPSIQRVNNDGNPSGPNLNSNKWYRGFTGDNEPPMSMYLAVDMDARHANYVSLGTLGGTENSPKVTGSDFNDKVTAGSLKTGDMIKIQYNNYYIKSIDSNSSLTIAGKFKSHDGNAFSGTGYVFNNTYTVLRDYIHLFNPTGNRNTFKGGDPYSMLITDGLSKQKISMGLEVDYYDDRALCKLSIGKIEKDLLGLVSFGEIFTLKSSVPTKLTNVVSARIGSTVTIGEEVEDIVNNLISSENISYDISDNREYPYYIAPNYQGVDIFNASNFAAKYKEKEIRIDETGVTLIKQSNDLDFQNIELSYNNKDLRIISVTRNKSTFDLFNEIIVYGSGLKSIKRNRKSIDKFGKKTLEDVNMELVSQDDVDNRAKSLLKAHSDGDDRFTVKMSSTGIELVKAGDIITLDFPSEGVPKDTYKIYEIRRELAGLIELEVGTYRKDLANRFAELSIMNKSNAASIRGSQFTSTTSPLDFFDSVKLKELRLVIKRIGLVDTDAFTLGFQTDSERLLDFGATMQPQETITEIIRDEDFI